MAFQVTRMPDHWVIVLEGRVTRDDIQGMGSAVLALESTDGFPNRIADLSHMTAAEFGFDEVLALAQRARERVLPHRVRTAIVVGNPSQMGFARMYQTLNDHPAAELQIFQSMDAARAWVQESDASTHDPSSGGGPAT